MKFKKIFIILISALTVFSMNACKDNNITDTLPDTPADISEVKVSDIASDNITIDTTHQAESSDLSETENNSDVENININNSETPADWSTEQIVAAYKSAAMKSNKKAVSKQSIELKNISVNNGEYEGLFEFITPIMSKLLANNSKENNGITGGYNNLVASDVASAKAYAYGNNIAIEMIMKEQISGARDNALEGSVGHAITAVGDIGVVTKQLEDLGLPLEISEKDTKIYYTKPVVKVLINKNGEIVNGTWSYTVDINLNNYKAFGKKVDTTSVVMDNIITVNGGFKK